MSRVAITSPGTIEASIADWETLPPKATHPETTNVRIALITQFPLAGNSALRLFENTFTNFSMHFYKQVLVLNISFV